MFECEANAEPAATFTWYRDNQRLDTSERVRAEMLPGGVARLIFDSTQVDDAGTIRVVASNPVGDAESSARLSVAPSPRLRLKRPLADQDLTVGARLRLECEVEGRPKTVAWYRGAAELTDSARTHIESTPIGDLHTLTIDACELRDGAAYRICLSNDAGTVESTCQVRIQEAKEAPEILEHLTPGTVERGDDAQLQVSVKGPIKTCKFYKNGDEMRNPKIERPDDATYRLVIPSAQKDDDAVYKVQFSNDGGNADSSAHLTVKQPAAAKIVRGLNNVEVPKGATATFEIETDKRPHQVRWYKNGTAIQPDDKAKPSSPSDTVHRLVLPDADEFDNNAQFKVVVIGEDEAPGDESSCALTVQLPPRVTAPAKIVRGLKDVEVPKGATATFEIETDKRPHQVRWYKNGKAIQPDDKAKPSSPSDTVHRLVLPDADEFDNNAQFKVVVIGEDEAPGDESSCALIVQLPPRATAPVVETPLSFLTPLRDQEAAEGARVEFACETSTPPHAVAWFVNKSELRADDQRVELHIDGGRLSAVLKWVRMEDAGEVQIRVESASGATATSAARLTINRPISAPPKILRGLKDQVNFFCNKEVENVNRAELC